MPRAQNAVPSPVQDVFWGSHVRTTCRWGRQVTLFEAYSDESGFAAEQYQALAIVSGPPAATCELRSLLTKILDKTGVIEAKFADMSGDTRHQAVARRFIEHAIEFAAHRRIRVDVLIWDTHDTRHAVARRDNARNLERMYYHVLDAVARRWHQQYWRLYPDELSGIRWQDIVHYLNLTRTDRPKRSGPRLLQLFDTGKTFWKFAAVEPVRSHEEPLVQLADLFAGIACFTRRKGRKCVECIKLNGTASQPCLWADGIAGGVRGSRSDEARFRLVAHLREQCRKHKLGVSLETRGYLCTPDPKRPVNFWNYESQHERDKAPTRGR